MITVAGEALIDLIVDPAGHIDPSFGGGPFNVVRAVARLGLPAAFLGRLSSDRFGRLMRADLDRHGVLAAVEAPADAPTTLAMVDVDPAGVPGYHFYLAGTSAAAIGPEQAIMPADTAALHIGSLGLVMEPVGSALEQLVTGLPAGTTVMLDPNCRPGAIASRQAYVDRLDRILRRVDLVKTSTEDLSYLFPGQGIEQAAAELLARGPACVVITDGAAAVRAFAGGRQIRAEVPPGRRRRHGGRRGRVRRRLPRLVDRQRVRPGRPARPGHCAAGHPCGHLRLGGDLHAPWRRTAVGR